MSTTKDDSPAGRTNSRVDTSPDAGVERKQGVQLGKSIVIDRPPAEVYPFWRHLENLPRFMRHLKSVRELDGKRSHWVAKGPLGADVEWDAEINNDVPNEKIGWQSLPEAEVRNAGSVQFEPLDNGQRTLLKVVVRYDPPVGKMGAAVAALLGSSPAHEIEADLKRLKREMESGEFSGKRAGGT